MRPGHHAHPPLLLRVVYVTVASFALTVSACGPEPISSPRTAPPEIAKSRRTCTPDTTREAIVALLRSFNERRLEEVVRSFSHQAKVAYFRVDEPVRFEFQAEGPEAIRQLFADRFATGEELTVREIKAFERPLGGASLVLSGRLPNGSQRVLDGKTSYDCEVGTFHALLLTPLAERGTP